MIIRIAGENEIVITGLRCRLSRLRGSENARVRKLAALIDQARLRGEREVDTELFSDDIVQEMRR
ncbi:MAG: hypothetical protein WCA44_17930 [Acidobacteriaceae bacterium]